MPKAYWISAYRHIHNPDALAAYAKLAGPAIAAAGGRFLARGLPAQVKESGVMQRTVLIEFDNLAAAQAAYGSPASNTDQVPQAPGAPWVFESPGITLKLFPCCYASHRAMDGLQSMMQEAGVDGAGIARIDCGFVFINALRNIERCGLCQRRGGQQRYGQRAKSSRADELIEFHRETSKPLLKIVSLRKPKTESRRRALG